MAGDAERHARHESQCFRPRPEQPIGAREGRHRARDRRAAGGSLSRSYELTVYGNAEPAGSKRAFYARKLKRAVVTDANPKSRDWKNQVAQEAGKIAAGFLEGPLELRALFYRPRPAGHYGTGRNAGVLKASAPPYPVTKPDTTKLLRAVEDALIGVFYRDDVQIVRQHAEKQWGEPARAVITVGQITEAP